MVLLYIPPSHHAPVLCCIHCVGHCIFYDMVHGIIYLMQHSVYHRKSLLSLVFFWYTHLPNSICVWWEYSSESWYIPSQLLHNLCVQKTEYSTTWFLPLLFFVIADKTQRCKWSYRNRKSQQSGSKNEKGIRCTTKWWYQLTTISKRKVL